MYSIPTEISVLPAQYLIALVALKAIPAISALLDIPLALILHFARSANVASPVRLVFMDPMLAQLV